VTQMKKVQAAKTTHKNTNRLRFTEMENTSKNRVATRIQVIIKYHALSDSVTTVAGWGGTVGDNNL